MIFKNMYIYKYWYLKKNVFQRFFYGLFEVSSFISSIWYLFLVLFNVYGIYKLRMYIFLYLILIKILK